MEGGKSSHGYPENSKSVSALPTIVDAGNSNTTTNSNNRRPKSAPGYKCEQEHYMPIANVTRIMRRALPPYARISDDAKEIIQECVSEYIHFITSEANERCHRESRMIVTAEDLLFSMGSLGFNNSVDSLTVFLNRYRQSQSELPSVCSEPSVDLRVMGTANYAMDFSMGTHRGLAEVAAMGAIEMNQMNGFDKGGPGASSADGSSKVSLPRCHPCLNNPNMQ